MNNPETSTAGFFEAKYREKKDPWDFELAPYEINRYKTIFAALSHRRYSRAFEPGCSVGVLTERLASICDVVEACDFSQTAVKQAQARCAGLPNVVISCQSLADTPPCDDCDLLVLSEIGYYFSSSEWTAIVNRLVAAMHPGTVLLAAHWLGTSPDHRMSGDAVHTILRSMPALHLEHAERHEGFRLDRWRRS